MIAMSFSGQVNAFRLCFCKFKIKTDTALTWYIYTYMCKLG